jgi:hypothetical protein
LKFVIVFTALLACTAQLHAAQSCEELKFKVTAKLDGKNVKGDTLEIVANDKLGDAKVVGSCEGGSKKLTYTRK